MAILKVWTGTEWYPVYYDTFMKRLEKRHNLGDIPDKTKARENLGLIGDNNETHYHDHRYYTETELSTPNSGAKVAAENIKQDNKNFRFVTDNQIDFWNKKVDRATISNVQPLSGLYDGFMWYNPTRDETMVYLDGQFRDVGAGKVVFGLGNFRGDGQETTIAHGLRETPIGISVFPTANPQGYLGEVWVRSDSRNIYVGNTGSYRGQFRYSIVYE